MRPGFLGQSLDVDVYLWRNRRTIYEQFSTRVHEQIVTGSAKDLTHCIIVSYYGEDHVRFSRHFRQMLRGRAAKLGCERCRDGAIPIVNRDDVKSAILQSTRHICAHPTDSNKTDVHDEMFEV